MYLYLGHSIAVLSMSSVRTVFVLVCTWYVYLYIPFSASEPRFTEFRGVWRDANMQVPDAQQPPAESVQIRTMTGVITEIPAQRMNNILTDQMKPPWKRQSAGLWMAWRHRNAVASTTCTVCLGSCQCQLPMQVKQWHTKTRWKAVLSRLWPRRSRSDLHHPNLSCTSMPWNTGTNWFDCSAYKECTCTCKYIQSTY